MAKYVKFISKTQIEYPPKNKGSIINYDQNVEMLKQDGYKKLVPAEVPGPEEIRMYHIEYVEKPSTIKEIIVFDETEEEAQQRIINSREEQFNRDFFQTSLGYIRRSVSMADGSHKDFLSDLLPSIALAVSTGTPVTVLAYDKPDFSQEITDWTIYQHIETVTAQFIQECFIQLQNDFLPINESEAI